MARPRQYPKELRERAVRMVAEIGEKGAIGRVAERLEELRQLRNENAELRRANEILKPASAFFAAELDRPRTR